MNESINLNDLDSSDFSNVSTGVPLIKAGVHEVSVLEIKPEPNKAGTGHNLKIKLGLTNPTDKVDGTGQVNVGYPIYTNISLVATEKYKPKENLARFMECFLGVKNVPFNPLEQYIGQTGSVRIKIEEDEQYGKKNAVAGYIKKG